MPGPLRIFAWRLLHAALPVGAARVKFVRPGNVPQLLQQCCQHPACQAVQPQPPLETLTHVFVGCPVAQRAWRWWRRVWLRLDPAAGLMPLDAQLLLGGQGTWRPSVQCASLWRHLRVLMLHSLWTARCSAAGTPSHTAQAVVGRFVAAVRHQVSQEWQRVSSDIRWGTGLPFLWFRGRDPSIQPPAFKARWCHRGVIASWKPPSMAAPAGGYVFHLSAAGV